MESLKVQRTVPCKDEKMYQALEKKESIAFHEDLLPKLMTLSSCGIKAYFVLYDQFDQVRKRTGMTSHIQISHGQLAKMINKSSSTAGRALRELNSKGYIRYERANRRGSVAKKIFLVLPEHYIPPINSS